MSEYASKTVKSILTKMEAAKYISDEQLRADLNGRYWFEQESPPSGGDAVGESAPAESSGTGSESGFDEGSGQRKPPFPPPTPPEDAVNPRPEPPGAPVSL